MCTLSIAAVCIEVNAIKILSQIWVHHANSQLESLHSRYTGTGHADLTKHEWLVHQHRDTYASIVGHPGLAAYVAIAENECLARTKFEMVERMLQPCGPPPKPSDDD